MGTVAIESLVALLNHCEQFSKRMLAEAGEFHPFAAFVNQRGEIAALGGYVETALPAGMDVYRLLQEALSSMAKEGKALAFAIAANVHIPSTLAPPFPDGIRIHVEADGYSRLVYTPYRQLPYRAVRKFLAVLPTEEYAEPITMDVPGTLFANARG